MYTLNSNSHSVFLLTYHLVLVVKYRREVLDDVIAARIRQIGEHIGANHHVTFLAFNHDQDHVHILFKAHPNTAVSKYINAFKSASSRLVKKEFPRIRRLLWKENFWSQSFCLLTTGGAPLEVLKAYIQSQGEKG
jgi:putative transposase